MSDLGSLVSKRALRCYIIVSVMVAISTLPLFAGYLVNFLFYFFIFLSMALMYSLLADYTGLISLGQGTFVGISGYIVGVLSFFGYNAYIAVVIGAISSLTAAVVLSKPLFQMKGSYFTIGTLAMSQFFRIFFSLWIPPGSSPAMWGGAGIPVRFTISRTEIYYLAFVAVLLSIFSIHLIRNSKIGLNLKAIRDDEDVAVACGIPSYKYKLFSLGFSSLLTGLVAAIFYLNQGYIDPEGGFALNWSLVPMMATIIGGLGSIKGSIIGAGVVTLFYLFLARYLGLSLLIEGMIVLIVALFASGGIIGIFRNLKERGFHLRDKF